MQRSKQRCQILALRNALTVADRAALSERIVNVLVNLPIYQNKDVFFIYCSYQSEVETKALVRCALADKKTVCVPLTLPEQNQMQAVQIHDPSEDLCPGYRTIPEPRFLLTPDRIVDPLAIEVVVLPGVVFDRSGHRLGYGRGYYDRFLAGAAPRAYRIGLAFSAQLTDHITNLPHDVPMDMVITENEILTWQRCGL